MAQKVQNKAEQQLKKEEEHSRVEDHIVKRFELLEFKGKGAYGVVWKAIERKTQQTVALKKVFDAFHNATDSQRTFREVIFLEQLTEHENIVKLQSVIKAENDRDLYMVFEYMETDLHKVIRAGILEPIHKKYVVYQCLKALKYIHSADLVHRDLKPSNLLINSQCKIKVADFGLARSLSSMEEDLNPVMTEYVATRWYRAPEILLGSQNYSKAVDMWSIGCIVGEMIVGKAIFAGNSTLNQLEKIIELIGRPKQEDLMAIAAPLANNVLSNIQAQKRKSFAQFFNGGSDDVIDFIRNCLAYNPKKRLTVEQGLAHPYLKEFYGSEAETVKDKKIQTYLNDNQKFSVKEYRQELYCHLANQKRQAHKQLVIRVQRTIERQQSSVSPQKTEQKPTEADKPVEQIENVQTVKRDTEVEPKARKIFHYKSASQASIKQALQQSLIDDVTSPNNKRVTTDAKMNVSRSQSNLKDTNNQLSQSFLPQMDTTTTPVKQQQSLKTTDKKMLTTTGCLNQQFQATGTNYFFNSPQQGISRKGSITRHRQQPRSLQTSQQSTPLNKNQSQNHNSYMDKSIGDQYKQYLSSKYQMNSLMNATSYESVFQQRIKQRK